MDSDEIGDQRLPHLPETPESVSLQALSALGVLSWSGLEGAGTYQRTLLSISHLRMISIDRVKAITL